MTNNVITIDIITAVISKAMNKRLYIIASTTDHASEITIYDENEERINFQIITEEENELNIYTNNGCINNIKIENDTFVYRFKLLVEDCINYSRNMALKDIEVFLTEDKKEDLKPKDINDLDNEDD